MSATRVAPPAAWVEAPLAGPRRLVSRIGTFCLIELQRLRHDRTELVTRSIQPVLWLVIFGVTFTRVRAIPTGSVHYLDYLAPGIIAQSALFVSIFYGIQVIWERDSGILTKLLVTPTPGRRWWPANVRRGAALARARRWPCWSSPRCSASA